MKVILVCFDWSIRNQIVYLKEKGIRDEAQFNRLIMAKLLNFDLSNAFDSITSKQVEYLLRYTFRVKQNGQLEFANKWTSTTTARSPPCTQNL